MSPQSIDDLLQFDEDPEPFDHRRMLRRLSHYVRMRSRSETNEVTHRFIVCNVTDR